MNTADETKGLIRKFISETSFTDINRIKDDSLIFREGFFDSMGMISLIAFLEDQFSIQISDADLVEDNFESVNAMHRYVVSRHSKVTA
ncbi:MAG TPA: acyl carrier protein [Bacteroidales bacterium]|nr:acyl carrier protein [Bacteroidales bacterium]